MSNVIPFPTRPAPSVDDSGLAVEMVADLFKAHITTLLSPELMDEQDAQMVEYLYLKYSEKFEEYMK